MQIFQYNASIVFFAIFILTVLARAALLRRKGIRAIVFGATDKAGFLLIPFVLAIIYAVMANSFQLPLWEPLLRPFWKTVLPGWVGLALSAAAIIGLIFTLISFGDSFRVGIDEEKPDILVTTGVFRFSRNPIYVCFDTFFIGLFLVHRNIIIVIAVIAFALLIHRQILREEKFLRSHYGAEYEEYCRKVRRYL
ncbi:methyltransferase family protein [Aminipila sp.]|uniref:methyltransferase family protein n=1 Tax=Aminipila sp. TaxID=2060095 RepID=UPI002899F449|nr:isoprenylcysteine carboxylmethyltransferase family protein [Aminipila sp.]